MGTPAKHLSVPILGACLVLLLGGRSLSAQQSGTGYLMVNASPKTAGLFVDDKYVGPACSFAFEVKYPIPAGEHEITLKDPRYQDFSTKAQILAGKTTRLSYSLLHATPASPPFGTLRIQGGSSWYDAVYLNGKFMGHLDEFNNSLQGVLLNPGEYILKVVSPSGNQELEEKIKIEEKKTTRIRVGSAG
jgi:hypothetical protein